MAAPLRILQVMRAPVGGLFRHVADLTRALAANGHQVGLVVDSLASDAQTESKLAELAPHARLGIHPMAMPRLLGAGDLTTPFAVRKLARSLEIEVIHGHGAKGGFYARLALLAAAAARLPVIATKVGGIPEIFGPTAASLVPAGDAEALGAAMQRTLDDPAAAQAEMTMRLAHIESRFSLATMAGGIEALYRTVLARG